MLDLPNTTALRQKPGQAPHRFSLLTGPAHGSIGSATDLPYTAPGTLPVRKKRGRCQLQPGLHSVKPAMHLSRGTVPARLCLISCRAARIGACGARRTLRTRALPGDNPDRSRCLSNTA